MLRTLMSLALGMTAGIGATAAYAQGTGGAGESSQQCMATHLRLRIATGNDDLRGGQDNLNIVVYFTTGGYQFAASVNHNQNWPNNSVNMVDIPLNRPIPPNEIRALRLIHIADGGFNIGSYPELATPAAPIAIAKAFQSPDNWNMADIEVAVIGSGVGGRIANHGFHRFTGSNPDLIIDTHVPANICSSGRPAGNSGGTGSGSSGGGSGMLMSQSGEKGMLATQPKSPALVEGNRPTNASNPTTPDAGANSGQGKASAKPLTNADILNMLRAGLPEEIILATIRSRPETFDVSNQARAAFDRECAKIKHVGLTTAAWAAEVKNIWDSMTNVMICQETNGRGGEDACGPNSGINNGNGKADELKPYPQPPKGKSSVAGSGSSQGTGSAPVLPKPSVVQKPTPAQAQAALSKLRSRLAYATPMTSAPPAAGEKEAAMLTALRQQKQAVQSGRIMAATSEPAGGQSTPPPGTPDAGGNLSGHPAGGQTNPNPNNPNNPNPNNPTGGQSPSGGSGSKPTGGSTRAVTPGAIVLAPQPATAAAPQRSGSSTIGSSATTSSKIDPCWVQGLPPGIKGINSEANLQGYGAAGVFSQDPFYNPFWLIGCHFGNAAGRAYLQSATGQKLADFQIMSPSDWSDTLIKATLDPSLVDVLDQDNVTLVITNAAGQQGQKSGFKFYARRQEYFLPSIPLSRVMLAKVVDDGGQNLGAYYSSPYRGFGFSAAVQANGGLNPTPTQEQIADLQWNNAGKGETAGADRNDWYRFNPGTDVYDFSNLKQGFSVSRFQLDGRTLQVCYPGVGFDIGIDDETTYDDGSWNGQYFSAQNQIRVTFAEAHCHYNKSGTDSSNSTYALNVWVKGPAVSSNTNLWQDGVK